MTDPTGTVPPPPHDHDWTMDPDGTGSFVTIDTYPPMYTWYCRICGAATHDPKTGEICTIGHFR